MQDHIPDALIAAFERQYDASWNDPQLRNERLAMRYGWAAAIEQKQCLVQVSEPAVNQQLTVAPVAVGGREAFEQVASDNGKYPKAIERDSNGNYLLMQTASGWQWWQDAWQARSALAATPAAGFDAGNTGNKIPVPKWIDDPHDIEQGQMLNPEWVKDQETAVMVFLPFSARTAIAKRHGAKVTAEFNALVRDVIAEYRARSVSSDFAAPAPVVLPHPDAPSSAPILRAMSENYSAGHLWDTLDAQTCLRAANEIDRLHALLAGVSAPAGAVPDGWREKFATDVYNDLAAADNQDVPLEEYPARILKVLDSIVGPRHPVVIKWRNDAVRSCIAIAYKYCRDPESQKYLKQDLEAMLTAEPAPQQADARDAAPAASEQDAPQQDLYYLQDARWSAMVGNCPSWWRPDGNGYTTNLDEAARFTFAEAMAQHRCRDTDLPWLCSEVDKLRRPTVDCQYMPRSWGEQRVQIHAQAAAKEGVQQG